MKIVGLCFVCFCCLDAVSYGINGTGYYDLPWSVEEAKAQGKWKKIDWEKKLNVDVFSLPEDPRIILLFDQRGSIAGIRLSVLKDDVIRKATEGGYEFDFDFYDSSEIYKKGKYFDKELWHTTVLFTNPDYLAWFGGRRTPNKNTDDVADTILKLNDYEELFYGTTDECRVNRPALKSFEGNCVPGLGKHYFFEQFEFNGCNHRLPIFLTYDQGKLVGFGLAGYGSHSQENKGGVNYYDHGAVPLKDMMRERLVPGCMKEYINKFGLISVHVFLTKNASKITCPEIEWKIEHCTDHSALLPFFEPFSG